MFKYLLLATFIPALFAFDLCSNGAPLPSEVSSSICAIGEVCLIAPGQLIDITATFESTVDASAASPQVTANLGGLIIDIPTPSIDDACLNLTPGCPIESGTEYTYSVHVDALIPDGLTGAEITVELSLVDASDSPFVCVSFVGKVV